MRVPIRRLRLVPGRGRRGVRTSSTPLFRLRAGPTVGVRATGDSVVGRSAGGLGPDRALGRTRLGLRIRRPGLVGAGVERTAEHGDPRGRSRDRRTPDGFLVAVGADRSRSEILRARWGLARLSLRRYAMLGGLTRYLPPSGADPLEADRGLSGRAVLQPPLRLRPGRGGHGSGRPIWPLGARGDAVVVGLLISHLRTFADSLASRAERGRDDGRRPYPGDGAWRKPGPPADDQRFQLLVAVERLKLTARYAEAADLLAGDLRAFG